MLDVMHMDNLLSGSLDFVSGCDNCTDMIMSVRRAQQELTHQYMGGCEECCSRDYPDDPVPSPDCGWRMSCHTRWSLWSGLQAAASRHWPPGRQGTPASSCHHHHVIIIMSSLSCHHVWHLSSVCYLLDHDTPEGSVRPAHYGHPETGRGAGDLHVAHLALQDRQPGDACNNNNENLKLKTEWYGQICDSKKFEFYFDLWWLFSLDVYLLTFTFILKRCTFNRAFCELKENDKDKWSLL